MEESTKKLDVAAGGRTLNPELELETKSFLKANESTLSRLSEPGVDGVWNNWIVKDLSQDDWVVTQPPAQSYSLPPNARSFLPSELISKWAEIAEFVREQHESLEGLRISQAQVLLAGDEASYEANQTLKAWASQYAAVRLEKTKYKKGGPVRQFRDIYLELLPKLEEIAFAQGTANRCFYGEFTDFLPSLLFDATCRSLIECKIDKDSLTPQYRFLVDDPSVWFGLKPLIDVYQWHQTSALKEILGMVAQGIGDFGAMLSNEQIKAKLSLLVSDIEEMRPFLRRNFNPENVLLELAPGLVLTFYWAVGRGVGIMPAAPSSEVAITQIRKKTSALSLTVSYDGLLTNFSSPWIDSETILGELPEALRVNLYIIEALHRKLFSFYEKVDVASILASFRARAAKSDDAEEPSEEEFAALCHVIAETVENDPAPGDVGYKPSFSAVRVQRLLAILSDKLGCEVRQGKGSEIVIFRSGGHHFRLGHHKRHNTVPAAVIKNMFKHVGITFQEWLKAIT